MAEPHSPLRYPGGKAALAPVLVEIIRANHLLDATYIEPYAGGAGAALGLLFGEHVARIVINDADSRIVSFWWAILNRTDHFIKMLERVRININEWHEQHDVYLHPYRYSRTRLGFATFFLNRCNRSGILMGGGPIGGYHQKGKWRVGARFDRHRLQARIERVALYRDRIELCGLDALSLLRRVAKDGSPRNFIYLDPPYYEKGSRLYLNAYRPRDHQRLATFLKEPRPFKWLASYDNVPEVRSLYSSFNQVAFNLTHTAYDRRIGHELLIYRDCLSMPKAALKALRGRLRSRSPQADAS